jgi:hypothetical protein
MVPAFDYPVPKSDSVRGLPDENRDGTQEAQARTQRAQERALETDFLCLLCLFCASCVPSPFPFGQSERAVRRYPHLHIYHLPKRWTVKRHRGNPHREQWRSGRKTPEKFRCSSL